MSDAPQETPEPEIKPHPLLLVLEEHLHTDQPDVLDEEAHYILQYGTRLLIEIWKSMDVAVAQMIKRKNLPMAIRTLGALSSKVGDLKKYSYNNFKNLQSWQVKINKLQRKLKRKLAERGSIKG